MFVFVSVIVNVKVYVSQIGVTRANGSGRRLVRPDEEMTEGCPSDYIIFRSSEFSFKTDTLASKSSRAAWLDWDFEILHCLNIDSRNNLYSSLSLSMTPQSCWALVLIVFVEFRKRIIILIIVRNMM